MGRTALLLGVIATTGACGPSAPAVVELTSRADAFPTPNISEGAALVVGDLLVLDAKPFDDDHKEMDTCVTATSSAPAVVEVRAVVDNCKLFVLLAESPGHADITFSADGTTAMAQVDVTAPP